MNQQSPYVAKSELRMAAAFSTFVAQSEREKTCESRTHSLS